MDNRRASWVIAGLVLLSILSTIGISYANYRYVIQDTGMNAFLPAWTGTRWFLTKGWSPYSQQTAEEAQKLAYGRLAKDGEDPGYFIYPFYSILVFGPFALIGDYAVARSIWMTVLEISLVASMVIAISLCHWRLSRLLYLIFLVFPLVWYYSLRAVLNGNVTVLCALWITLALLAIRSNHETLAAIFLAFTSLQIQMTPVLLLFILVWAAASRRWSLVWSLVASFAFMITVPILFIPDWVMEYVRRLVNNADFGVTPGELLTYWLPGVGKQLGRGLTLLMSAMLLWEWRQCLEKDYRWFLWTACLTLAASYLIGLDVSPVNYVSLLPAFVLVLATWDERWGKLGRFLTLLSLLMFSVGIWALSVSGVARGISPDLDVALVFGAPLFIIMGLYWVRWWAINPPRLLLEMLSKQVG